MKRYRSLLFVSLFSFQRTDTAPLKTRRLSARRIPSLTNWRALSTPNFKLVVSVSKIRAVASSSGQLPSINGGSPRLHRGACVVNCFARPFFRAVDSGVSASRVAPGPEALLDEPVWTILTTGTALAVFQLREIGPDWTVGNSLPVSQRCLFRPARRRRPRRQKRNCRGGASGVSTPNRGFPSN